MQAFTATNVKVCFGEFLDRAQREPVGVLRHGRMVGVLLSSQDFEAMRAFCAERLQHELEASAKATAWAGLRPELLAPLLADRR